MTKTEALAKIKENLAGDPANRIAPTRVIADQERGFSWLRTQLSGNEVTRWAEAQFHYPLTSLNNWPQVLLGFQEDMPKEPIRCHPAEADSAIYWTAQAGPLLKGKTKTSIRQVSWSRFDFLPIPGVQVQHSGLTNKCAPLCLTTLLGANPPKDRLIGITLGSQWPYLGSRPHLVARVFQVDDTQSGLAFETWQPNPCGNGRSPSHFAAPQSPEKDWLLLASVGSGRVQVATSSCFPGKPVELVIPRQFIPQPNELLRYERHEHCLSK